MSQYAPTHIERPRWTPPKHLPPQTSAYSKPLQPHPSYYKRSRHNPVPPEGSATLKNKWMIPLCYEPKDDMETCCVGYWCPSTLYGHTQYRLKQLERNKDPLDMSEFKVINGPCVFVCVVKPLANFDRVYILAQHSRIRDKYNIEGTVCGDYLASYYCPTCTLIQDDREIRARAGKSVNMEKVSGIVNLQPKTEPQMQYTAPSLLEDGATRSQDSLVRQEVTSSPINECQTPRTNDQRAGRLHKFSHSKSLVGLKKFKKDTKVEGGDDRTGRTSAICNSQELKLSNNEDANTAQSTNRGQEDLDALSSPRLTSRHQNTAKKQDRFQGHSLSACSGDGTGSSENQDPITNRCSIPEHSEDSSISKLRGKQVLKQLARAQGRSGRTAVGNTSESVADEPVLVYYDDGDHPQKHLLADCARFRSSTIGRTDTPDDSEKQAGWRVEKTVGRDDTAEKSKLHTLDTCQEASIIEKPVRVISEHSMSDCTIQDITGAKDTKQIQGSLSNHENNPGDSIPTVPDILAHQDLVHSLQDCKSPVSVTTPDLTEQNINQLGLTEQHRLESCHVEPLSPADPIPPVQHGMADCVTGSRESALSTETASFNGPPVTELLSPNQHHLIDCASGIESPGSVDSGELQSGRKMQTYHGQYQSTSGLGNDQNEQHIVTITVPQPPVIIVTTSEALEEAMRDQHDPIRNRNPEIVIMSQDTQTSMEALPGRLSSLGNHDGAADNQEGSRQVADTAAVVQSGLHSATDPNVKAKKLSTRTRSKTIGGRVQKEKS